MEFILRFYKRIPHASGTCTKLNNSLIAILIYQIIGSYDEF